jgi:hypothetical protein
MFGGRLGRGIGLLADVLTHTHTHTQKHIYTHARTSARTHHIYTHTHAHARTETHTHTHTHMYTHTGKRNTERTIAYIPISMEIQNDDEDFVICGLERAPTLFGRNVYSNLLVFNLFHNFLFEYTVFRFL